MAVISRSRKNRLHDSYKGSNAGKAGAAGATTGTARNVIWWRVLLLVFGVIIILLFISAMIFYIKKEKKRVRKEEGASFRLWWVIGKSLAFATGVEFAMRMFKKCGSCCGSGRKKDKEGASRSTSYEKLGPDADADGDREVGVDYNNEDKNNTAYAGAAGAGAPSPYQPGPPLPPQQQQQYQQQYASGSPPRSSSPTFYNNNYNNNNSYNQPLQYDGSDNGRYERMRYSNPPAYAEGPPPIIMPPVPAAKGAAADYY